MARAFTVLAVVVALLGLAEAFTLAPDDTDLKDHVTQKFTGVPADYIVRRRGLDARFLADSATQAKVKLTVTFMRNQAELGVSGSVSDERVMTWTSTKATVGKNHYIVLSIPIDAAVGKYTVTFSADGATKSWTMVVLMNPWASKEAVAMDPSSLEEYVLNEEGLIWEGNSEDNFPMHWNFHQFQFKSLQVALNMLRRLPYEHRQPENIALLARHVTYSVNEDFCYGKWMASTYTTGHPSDGYRCKKKPQNCFPPQHWKGTDELVSVHIAMNNQRVQYCQCYVYSAVFTTFSRALGLPARPVTNFQSAHDVHRNRAVEKFFDVSPEGAWNEVEGMTGDSTWDFHVWNEVYVKRFDLNAKKPSWQAVDATPQEFSSGGNVIAGNVYQMGPADIDSVKKNKDAPCKKYVGSASDAAKKAFAGCYDQNFVISETNSNVNLWIKSGKGFEFQEAYQVGAFSDSDTIGQQISTKKPGPISAGCRKSDFLKCSRDQLDVTSRYKKAEPSGPGNPTTTRNPRKGEEWTAYKRQLDSDGAAAAFVEEEDEEQADAKQKVMLNVQDGNQVKWKLEVPTGAIYVEDPRLKSAPFVSALHLHNSGATPVKVHVLLKAQAASYTGRSMGTVAQHMPTVPLAPGATQTLRLSLTSTDLMKVIDAFEGNTNLRLLFTGRVVDASGATLSGFVQERSRLLCGVIHSLRSVTVCKYGVKVPPRPSGASSGDSSGATPMDISTQKQQFAPPGKHVPVEKTAQQTVLQPMQVDSAGPTKRRLKRTLSKDIPTPAKPAKDLSSEPPPKKRRRVGYAR